MPDSGAPPTVRCYTSTMVLFIAAFWVGAAAGSPRVVVIGVDGADPRVVRELWSRGELPALRSLADRGFVTEIASAYASKSPIIWTTVATGHPHERHGIHDFLAAERIGSGDSSQPVSSADRKVKALWEIASEQGRSVLVAGWWASWPVTAVSGLMVSDRPAPIRRDRFVWPEMSATAWASWVAGAQADFGDAFPGNEFVAPVDRLVSYAAVRQMKEAPPDAAWLYLRRPDVVSHHYWHGYESIAGNDPTDSAAAARILFDAYRAVDRSIGQIVAAAPADTRFLVLSDHGFHLVPDETRVRLDFGLVLVATGLLVRDGPHADPTRSRFLTLPGDYTAASKFIRVNLQGRDPGGIVPQAELAALLVDTTRRIEAVTYMDTGRAAFQVVAAPAGAAFDLEVRVQRGPFARTGLVIDGKPFPNTIEKVWRNTGGHNKEPQGILIAAGPGIGHAPPLDPSVKDVAVTTLSWLGLPVGGDMIGRPWTEVLTGESTLLATVPTWEGEAVAPGPVVAPEDDGVKAMLRELGYIE